MFETILKRKKSTITKIHHVFFFVVGFGLLVLGFFLRSQDYFLRLRSIFQASHHTELLVTSPSGETSSHEREVSLLPLSTGRAQSLPTAPFQAGTSSTCPETPEDPLAPCAARGTPAGAEQQQSPRSEQLGEGLPRTPPPGKARPLQALAFAGALQPSGKLLHTNTPIALSRTQQSKRR